MSATLACISWNEPIGLAELLALANVGQHHVEAGLHDAQRPGRQHRALIVEAAHQHPGPAAERTHDVLGRNLAVLEHQFGGVRAAHAHLVELLGDAEALHALLDQEGGDAAEPAAGVGLGVDHQGVGVRGVGDPELRAVQHIDVAALLGAQARMEMTSEPEPASLIAREPTCSPLISLGR
jgi:hypothetical protein